jgi:predicted enzyme related to lactoylglutathione lyase
MHIPARRHVGPDTKAAARFYSSVVGWGTQEQGAAGKEYTLFTVNGQGVARLMPIPEDVAQHGAKPAWLGYMSVEDVDAAAVKLKQLGGTVHREPQTVPGIIRFAVVPDNQGAAFYVARGLAKEAMPEFPIDTPGTVGWHELYATEWKAAFAFYEAMFGWIRADSFGMGELGTYQLFATGGGAPVGGMMTKPPGIPRPFWGYYFNVPAIDAAADRVTAAGGTIMMSPE